jgi:phage-related minor tail protein
MLQTGLDIGRNLLSGISNALSAGFDFASSIVGNIEGAIRGAVNNVIDALNRAIPDRIGGPGPFGFDLPANPIPRFAQGGIVTRATLAVIGEAGPEAIIPLGGASAGGLAGSSGTGQFRDLIINTRTEASAVKIAREVRWAQLTAGV